MNLRRLIASPVGKIIISIVLGIGLASLFRKVCNDRNCIIFNGPVITNVEGKTFKHGSKCYKYTGVPEKCNDAKRILSVAEPESKNPTDALLHK